jgi:hypothetical protein
MTDIRMDPTGQQYLCEDGEPVRRLQPGADDEIIDGYPEGPDLDETPEE